jgi:allantoicase
MSFTELPDLALEDLGSAVLWANDEFFAQKENLLKASAAEWREHEYTDRGKWMDGWETRRRREPGFDSCIIRLGLPGIVKGVVVDTAFFRGNYPAQCSLEGGGSAEGPWIEVLPRSELKGDGKNLFEISAPERCTHLRFHIYPDGGVARLRVHGEVAPDWARLARYGGLVDLAALENGARSLACSDMFFGNRNNLLLPGRPRNMSSGWETRRRRGPGHDWNLVGLGKPGVIRRVEIDTTHFKGNAPGQTSLEASSDGKTFIDLLPRTATLPHHRHFFERELRCVGKVSHLRLNVFPDGGVARLRAWGELELPRSEALQALNEAPREEAARVLKGFCGSESWARKLADARPFEDTAALYRLAERIFWQLDEPALLQAFAAHPRIGQRAQGEAQAEQGGVRDADRQELLELNEQYFARNGFVFLVCASGREGVELLQALKERLGKTRAEELRTAAEEQAKILRLRIGKYLEPK